MTSLAIITVSDTAARGLRDDASGRAVAECLADLCPDPLRITVADDIEAIREAVRSAAASHVIVLTGGTGLAPRDVTPQALAPLLDFEVPGMAEAMRSHGAATTPRAMLSRQVVGVMGSTLVLALPGSERAVRESLDAVIAVVPHALELLAGATQHTH